MASNDESLSEVHIGNVTGGIHGSIIAGRDVTNAVITLGGQPTPADKEPTLDELKQLLAEIQKELAEVLAEKEALEQISDDTPIYAQAAQVGVRKAAEKAEKGETVQAEEAESLQKSLTKASSTLSDILDGAKTLAQKSVEVGRAVKPIAEKLEPLVEKLGVAALWAAKLWLMG